MGELDQPGRSSLGALCGLLVEAAITDIRNVRFFDADYLDRIVTAFPWTPRPKSRAVRGICTAGSRFITVGFGEDVEEVGAWVIGRRVGVRLLGAHGMAQPGDEVRIRSDAAWDVMIVHGPRRDKIVNRIELLHRLEATGGRRA